MRFSLRFERRSPIGFFILLISNIIILFEISYFVDHEELSLREFLNSLYYTVTVMSTVGLGDNVPESTQAKLLYTVGVIFNMLFIGLIIEHKQLRVLRNI